MIGCTEQPPGFLWIRQPPAESQLRLELILSLDTLQQGPTSNYATGNVRSWNLVLECAGRSKHGCKIELETYDGYDIDWVEGLSSYLIRFWSDYNNSFRQGCYNIGMNRIHFRISRQSRLNFWKLSKLKRSVKSGPKRFHAFTTERYTIITRLYCIHNFVLLWQGLDIYILYMNHFYLHFWKIFLFRTFWIPTSSDLHRYLPPGAFTSSWRAISPPPWRCIPRPAPACRTAATSHSSSSALTTWVQENDTQNIKSIDMIFRICLIWFLDFNHQHVNMDGLEASVLVCQQSRDASANWSLGQDPVNQIMGFQNIPNRPKLSQNPGILESHRRYQLLKYVVPSLIQNFKVMSVDHIYPCFLAAKSTRMRHVSNFPRIKNLLAIGRFLESFTLYTSRRYHTNWKPGYHVEMWIAPSNKCHIQYHPNSSPHTTSKINVGSYNWFLLGGSSITPAPGSFGHGHWSGVHLGLHRWLGTSWFGPGEA